MSIQSPGVFTVWTGLAFEKGEPPVALLLGSENPHRHEDIPRDPKSETQQKQPRGRRPVCWRRQRKGAGYRRGTIEFLEKAGGEVRDAAAG